MKTINDKIESLNKFFKFVKERDNMLVMYNYNLKHNAYNKETLEEKINF